MLDLCPPPRGSGEVPSVNGLGPSGPGDAASGMTALIFHLVVTGVLLPALIDYVRHRMTAGRTLLRWQPSVPCYYRALRRHGERPPLDALIVITAGYAALLALGNPVWQLRSEERRVGNAWRR